jgi:putative membrane protein
MSNLQFRSKRAILVLGSVVLCGGIAIAQSTPGGAGGAASQGPGQSAGANAGQNPGMDSQMNGMQTTGGPSPTDKMFVSKALQGGMAEVQLGQLTLQKSNNEQIKQFAQRMIDDHTKLGEQMKPIAQQAGVSAPSKVSKKDKKTMDKLQALSGTEYDQAYVKDMIKDHKTDLSEFQMEASSGQDPTIKDAANQGSKLIAEHLQMIQQIAKDQNVSMAGQ